MDLIEILDKNLRTKNEIRDILGETNNISRYPIAIHNNIARKYNEGYVDGYRERYYELTGSEVPITGPEIIYDYGVDDTFYQEYTTEVLTDIMRDCLNYRIGMRYELEIDTDDFVTYPDYLRGKIESAYDIGKADGKDKADEAYEGDEDVAEPTISNNRNKITMSVSQTEARIKFKIGEDGIEYEYTTPIIIGETCTVFACSILGQSKSNWVSESCTYDHDGFVSFVTPPVATQKDNMMYLTCSLSNCSIEYKVDNGTWNVYTHPFGVTNSDLYVYMRSSRAGEFSSIIAQPIQHNVSVNRPANVQCSIEELGDSRRINLSCSTTGAQIRYAINDNTGTFLPYNSPVIEASNHFIVYTFSIKDEIESPNRLYYKYDKKDIITPQEVQFRQEGNNLVMYCTTDGAVIWYCVGDVSKYNNGGSNYVTITPPDGSTITAYASLNDVLSSTSSIVFRTNKSDEVQAPQAWLDDNNMIIIDSIYTVRYTTDGSDPKSFGNKYSSPILISDTTTLKCVAIDGIKYSDVKSYTFTPKGDTVTPGGGSTGGTTDKDYFWMTGTTRLNISNADAGKLYFYTGSGWAGVTSDTRFDKTQKTFFYGNNLSRFTPVYDNSPINIGGNLYSLKDGKNFNPDLSEKSYSYLFKDAPIFNAVDLNIRNQSVRSGQYEGLFEGCDKLISAPLLTANTIGSSGYKSMFKNCMNLPTVPSLPAQSLGDNCYESMFENCISITNLDMHIVLSSPNLATECYKAMFKNCVNLEWAPALPSDNMKPSCYESMFEGCTSLREAPYLPAVQLVKKTGCYNRMFNGCRSLNYIKAMFINEATGIYTAMWVENVASSGTFVKNEEARWSQIGPSAVPEGWTVIDGATDGQVIFDYNKYTGELKMTSTTNDEIWYTYDDVNNGYIQYDDTNRPRPTKSCWVFAKCKNKYGNFSTPNSCYINVSYPNLIATLYNGVCNISAAGYNYSVIKYGFTSTESGTPSYFATYPPAFPVENDTWIVMRGYVAGSSSPVQENRQFLIPSLSAPTFSHIGDNADGSKSYWKIAWNDNSHEDMKPIIYWSLNSYEDSAFQSAGASTYQIIINWNEDSSDRLYYAKASVLYNGIRVFTSIASAVIRKGQNGGPSVTLYEPRFYHIEGNTYGIEYPDENGNWIQYSKWDADVPQIYYRFGSEEAKNFGEVYPVNTADYRNKPTYGGDVEAWCWAATDSFNKSREHPQILHYDASLTIPTPDSPIISVVQNFQNPQQPYYLEIGGTYYSGYAKSYQYKIDVLETAGNIPSSIPFVIGSWADYSGRIYLPAWIGKARIYAKAYLYLELVGGEWSEVSEWNKDYGGFVNEYNPVNICAPYGHVEKLGNNYVLYIDIQDEYTTKYQAGTMYRYFSLADEDADWARDTTFISFAEPDHIQSVLSTGFSFQFYPGFYGCKKDIQGFKVWWEYHVTGIDPVVSEVYSFYWRDPDAPTGPEKPSFKITQGNPCSKLEIINNYPDYDIFWKIENPRWAGGVVNTDKYNFNPPKRWTWNYGVTLDEFLIGGTVVAWCAEDVNHLDDNYKAEETFTFDYNGIPNPTISFSYSSGGDEIIVANKNKYCTSYYRWDNESSYSLAHKYGNSIYSSRLSGYAYAYSIWGDERSSTVISYYDSGISTTYPAPSISVDTSTGTNLLTISFDPNLPAIIYKIDPTEWDGQQISTNIYVGDYNTEWLRIQKLGSQTTYSMNLSPHLISGTIQAFCSNCSNPKIQSNIDSSNNSEVTTYSFVNGNYS